MLCPNCGSENREGAKFCDECGIPLGGAIARTLDTLEGRANRDAADNANLAEKAVEEDGTPETEAEASEIQGSDNVGDDDLEHPENDDDPEKTKAIGHLDVLSKDKEAASDELSADQSDITAVISESETPGNEAHEDEDDEFAGFTKHADDGYSYDAPLSFANDASDPLTSQDPGFTMKMPRVEAGQTEKNRDYRASSTVPKKSNAKVIGIIVAIVAVIGIVALAGFALGLWGGKTVPDVAGMTETDARAVLEDSGFKVRSAQVKSDDTEGLVLIMDPNAGSRVSEGSEVIIHVATARLVPDIVGKPKDEAAAVLADAGYDNIKYEQVKSEGDEGIVLSVTPEAGSRAKSSAEITVGVSEPFRVPDISGMNWDDAFAAIADAGLVSQIVYVNNDNYYEGSIIGTVPEAGAVVPEGSVVTVNVAQSRATLLTSMTQNLLVPGSTINVNGYNYTIDALVAVSYMGNDTVAFTFTGRPYVSLLGENLHASSQTVSGQVVWSPYNQVVSIS